MRFLAKPYFVFLLFLFVLLPHATSWALKLTPEFPLYSRGSGLARGKPIVPGELWSLVSLLPCWNLTSRQLYARKNQQ